jgi:hypothetical protein
MAMGGIVRWRLRDTWWQIDPAAILGLVNALLFLHTLNTP